MSVTISLDIHTWYYLCNSWLHPWLGSKDNSNNSTKLTQSRCLSLSIFDFRINISRPMELAYTLLDCQCNCICDLSRSLCLSAALCIVAKWCEVAVRPRVCVEVEWERGGQYSSRYHFWYPPYSPQIGGIMRHLNYSQQPNGGRQRKNFILTWYLLKYSLSSERLTLSWNIRTFLLEKLNKCYRRMLGISCR